MRNLICVYVRSIGFVRNSVRGWEITANLKEIIY